VDFVMRAESGFWSALFLALGIGLLILLPAENAGTFALVAGVSIAAGVYFLFLAFFPGSNNQGDNQ
jgi:hypothetical protein